MYVVQVLEPSLKSDRQMKGKHTKPRGKAPLKSLSEFPDKCKVCHTPTPFLNGWCWSCKRAGRVTGGVGSRALSIPTTRQATWHLGGRPSSSSARSATVRVSPALVRVSARSAMTRPIPPPNRTPPSQFYQETQRAAATELQRASAQADLEACSVDESVG